MKHYNTKAKTLVQKIKRHKKMIETLMYGMQLLCITYLCYWATQQDNATDEEK